MNVEVLQSEQKPSLADFVSLEEHESQTPETFFGGKPVLHFHAPGCHLLFNEAAFQSSESLKSFVTNSAHKEEHGGAAQTNGSSVALTTAPSSLLHDMVTDGEVEAFVTSRTLQLWSPSRSIGLNLPYPSISLHAIQRLTRPNPTDEPARYIPYASNSDSDSTSTTQASTTPVQALYLQLDPLFAARDNTNPDIDNQDPSTAAPPLELYIIPQAPAANTTSSTPPHTTQDLFDALSRCADLNPDPADMNSDDDDGDEGYGGDGDERFSFDYQGDGADGLGLGSGWITSENAHLHADRFADPEEDGDEDEAGQTSLGPGAGQRRGREESEGERQGAVAEDQDEELSEETKWQRTG